MKCVCELLLIFVLFAFPAQAGVNAGGALVAHDASYGAIGFDRPGTQLSRSTGACCDSLGACAVVDSTTCVHSHRLFRGMGSTCSPNPCPEPGTCCIGYGECVFVPEPWCLPIPGIFLPGGFPGDCATCRPTETGYCCIFTTCVAVDWITCALQQGLFHLSGNPEPCLPNPCYTSHTGNERPGFSELSLEPPVPNPSRGAIQYAINLRRPGQIRVLLLDVTGRQVLHLLARQLAAGTHSFSCDLVDQNGVRLPSGLYTLRLDATLAAEASAGSSAHDQGRDFQYESRIRRVILLR